MNASRHERARELRFERAWFIDGEWCGGDKSRRFLVRDPSTQEEIATLPEAGAEETLAAVESARRALPAWSATSVTVRADLLWRIVALLEKHREALAHLAVLEQGMPLAQNLGAVDYGISFFRWFAEEARRIYGRTVCHPDPRRHLRVEYFPRGVAGIITPWNAPLGLPAKKIAAALAAGCTLVLKPSELTPLSALALAWIAREAGLPPGVLNVVCGDAPAIGQVLLEHPAVRTISFTGSLRTGKYLYAEAARSIKHVCLELGGNAPFIVFADADFDRAVEDLVWLKRANSGQICLAANRVYVERSIYPKFRERLLERYGQLLVGDGFCAGVEQGPLITPEAVQRVDALVQQARTGGARLLCGGRLPELGPNFYAPTVLEDVAADARIVHEEIFGPVLPLFPFEDETAVVRAANATASRLAAYAYTTDLNRAWRLSRALEFGVVGLNDPRPVSCETPFGGADQGGIGREGGSEGMHEFLESRLIGLRV